MEIGVWAIFLEIFKHLKVLRVASVDFQEALNCLCPVGTSENLARQLPAQLDASIVRKIFELQNLLGGFEKLKTNEKRNFSIKEKLK